MKYTEYLQGLISSTIKTLLTFPWHNPILIIKHTYKHFQSDSLYQNSIYLILSTFVMSFVGFLFWTINTKFYSTDQIGVATALISLVSLITGFGTLGLSTGTIRYLPSHKNKNELISTAFSIVGLASLLITIIYLVFINIFSPKLIFITQNTYLLLFFITFVPIAAINVVSDSVFIAYKSTKYIFIYDIFYSLTRLLMPLFLVTLGAIGIFLSHTVGVFVCLFLTYYFLIKKFDYKISFKIDINILKEIGKFSIGSYTANLIGNLPSTMFPIIILNKLGPNISAYYYMDMMLVSFLYMIPISISQSMFAESSHDEGSIKKTHNKKHKDQFFNTYSCHLNNHFSREIYTVIFWKRLLNKWFRVLMVYDSFSFNCAYKLYIRGLFKNSKKSQIY